MLLHYRRLPKRLLLFVATVVLTAHLTLCSEGGALYFSLVPALTLMPILTPEYSVATNVLKKRKTKGDGSASSLPSMRWMRQMRPSLAI